MKNAPLKVHSQPRGFALIVTLSLMILLTVVAVGLLSLSIISLRSTGQSDAMATARANSKLALMLAIGDLQKAAGPDKRITAPANLVNPSAPAGVTGVWKSARPSFSSPEYVSTKNGGNFLGYLMSNANPATAPDPKTLPIGSAKVQQLVGVRSVGVGNAAGEISTPLVSIAGTKGNAVSGSVSWVTLDEGVKGRIDLLPSGEPTGQGDAVTQVGSAARNGFETVEKMDFLKADKSTLMSTLPKLVSLNEANLQSNDTSAVARYFHDFTVSSNSIQVDVANGGLKTDLSVAFDGNFGDPVPAPFSTNYLYSNSDTPFQGSTTTSDVQWSLYANYARLYRRTTANDNPKVGIKAALPAGYALKSISDLTLKQIRYEPDMAAIKQPVLMPTVLRVDTVFTMVTHNFHNNYGNATYPYQLHMMYLPVVTLHNPYNVPLRVSSLQVEFSDIPIGFEFLVNNQPTTTNGLMPINQLYYGDKAGKKKTFNMQLSSNLNNASEVVMGAGETRIFGTPFPATTTWGAEVAKNGYGTGLLFDWQSNQTTGALTVPGMITGQNDGVGFDIDWLAPNNRSPWLVARNNNGAVILKAADQIKVRYGPLVPATASTTNSFGITVRLGNQTVGTTQVFYANAGRLKTIMEEGTSERFPEKRSFPETWPRAAEVSKTTMDIYEANGTAVKDYVKARPFAIFSVSAKTTKESFTKSRPVADTGVAFQMATCDFTTTESQGSSPLEFALVPVKSGGLVIESGGVADAKGTSQQGFFFGGNGSTHGANKATLYEIPMAPLQSIAQLRHANGGSLGSIPFVTYTVGESRAHPAVPSEAAFYQADDSRTVLDRSWLANDQLWDRYWFSTLSTLQGMAYSGATTQQKLSEDFFNGVRNLPNQRNTAYVADGKTAAESAAAARTAGGARSAANILTKGGFNVNSTSVRAWISVLSGLATSDVPLVTGSADKNPDGTPFLRIRQPVGGALSANEKLWNSYRSLDDAAIKQLAEEIVAEVKSRGPFLSMAEFVNRRLGTPGELTSKGAIQAALDRTNINTVMESNALTVSPAEVSNYGWKNPDAVTKNTGAGAPGEVSQGDVLSAIGSFVSVRSDTFRIRAFGDARNAAGTVIARAWCEATVQRVPDYIDPANPPYADTASLTAANIEFGRQFRIISFRWLHPNEI